MIFFGECRGPPSSLRDVANLMRIGGRARARADWHARTSKEDGQLPAVTHASPNMLRGGACTNDICI